MAIVGGVMAGYLEYGQAASTELPTMPVPAGKDWVKFGKADIGITGNAMNIHQRSDKAILHWNSFNIGTKNQVNFQQPRSTSIALNRIFQNDPSKILGQLNANGQVYLVNQNGFVFDKNSSVNVHTLVASSLDIKDDVFKGAGITKIIKGSSADKGSLAALEGGANPASKIDIKTGAKIHAGQGGRIILAAPEVNNGGELNADKSGQIMLIGSQDKVYLAEKSCAGAGSDCNFNGLLVEVGTGGKVTNTNLGNIAVRQGDVTLAGFAVNQEGRVTATTSAKVNGTIHLQARQGVNDTEVQNSKSLDTKPTTGTVRDNNGQTERSQVKFGVASLTQIGIDSEDTHAVDEQVQPQSLVDVAANIIHVKKDAVIHAPNAKVNITAGGNPKLYDQAEGVSDAGGTGEIPLEGRIILDEGVKIDVSGAKNISASVSRNVVDVPVQSFELRDSPLQKGGVLQGKTVKVDSRRKPGIVDIGGAEKRIGRTTEERLARQLTGQVNLIAAGEVDVNSGGKIDISGGKVTYQGGQIETTKLMTDNGKIIDISEADPNVHYKSVLGIYEEVHQKWGITRVWRSGLISGQSSFESGYVEGLNAGVFNIETPRLFWQGDLLAGATSGIYQRDNLPNGGKWSINESLIRNGREKGVDGLSFNSQQNIHIKPTQEKAATLSDAGQLPELVIGADQINRSGIEEFSAKTTGNAKLDPGAKISLPAKGSFDLLARNVDIQGDIHATGGAVNLTASWNEKDNFPNEGIQETSVFNDAQALTDNDGLINIAKGAVIDVSGRWVNDFATSLKGNAPTEPTAIDGGKIALTTGGHAGINLQNGATMKADGGALLTQEQKLEAGQGGQLTFTGKEIPNAFVFPEFQLDGALSAYGLNQGGTLSLNQRTNNFIIGQAALHGSSQPRDTYVLDVTNQNFKINGINSFGKLELDGGSFSELTLKNSTVLNLQQQNLALVSDYLQQGSADSLSTLSTPVTLPAYLRKPVDLSLKAGTNLVLGQGSKIQGDPGAQISLASAGNIVQNQSKSETSAATGAFIYLDGLVRAPGGNIDIGMDGVDSTNNQNRILSAVWLGKHAALDTSGTTIFNPPDALNRRTGEVLSGGSVNLYTDWGHVIVEQGSQINVSGTRATLDLPDASLGGGHTVSTVVGSDAGKIDIKASESVVLDGGLLAHAGSGTASGGRFNLDFVGFSTGSIPDHSQNVLISQRYQRNLSPNDKVTDLLDNLFNSATKDDGTPFNFITGSKFNDPTLGLIGTAKISADQIQQGGFAELRLSSRIDKKGGNPPRYTGGVDSSGPTNRAEVTFAGNVNLSVARRIDLDVPNISWSPLAGNTSGGSEVVLNSAMLKAGSSDTYRLATDSTGTTDTPPTPGPAKFTSNTAWTEFNGASNWNGFAELNFNSRHDIRVINSRTPSDSVAISELDSLGAKLNTAGNINLTASQIYPATFSNFIFKIDPVENPNGKITIANSGLTDESPLSAGGVLTFDAPIIQQGGTVKAPFGKLNFQAGSALTLAKGSLTSVSGNGLLVPFGNILNGQAWVYPGRVKGVGDSDRAELIASPPEKKLTLSGPDMRLEKGSEVDLSGGGDLAAAEFAPGIGGSFDYLGTFVKSTSDADTTLIDNNHAYQGGFAVLPSLRSALAPYDPLLNSLNTDSTTTKLNPYNYQDQFGKQVYLSGSSKLSAGFYTILPARYALMPGAYLITPQENSQDQRLTSFTASGLPVVAGYRADAATGARDQRWSGFLIEDGKDIRTHAQFNEATANAFFNQDAAKNAKPVPILPQDSGQLVFKGAQTRLTLNGDLAIRPGQGGRSAKVDIAGDNLSVVNSLSAVPANGVLEILANNLANLGAGSLLLGGERIQNSETGNTDLNISAQHVSIGKGAVLSGPDLIIAAQNEISVRQGAKLSASGKVNTGDKSLNIVNVVKPDLNNPPDPSQPPTPNNDGALLRLSADDQVTLIRKDAAGQSGKLSVDQGASLNASNSMLLDASSDSTIAGDIAMQGGSINLSANTVNLGDVGNLPKTGALNLSNADFAKLKVDNFVLSSRSMLNLYGNAEVRGSTGQMNTNLTISAQGIRGYGKSGDVAQLSVNHLLLQNLGKQDSEEENGTGSGRLNIDANTYEQGAGAFSISGFKSFDVAVKNAFQATHNGSLKVEGDLNLKTGYLTAASGANLTINASGKAAISSPVKSAQPNISDFGGAITLNAASINFNAKAILPSGDLSLQSSNGNVSVDHNADINLAGKAVPFADTFDYTKGGEFKARADKGNVELKAGSSVDVRSGGGKESSGKLDLGAKRLLLAGNLNAQGGSAALDVADFGADGFDGLMDKMKAAGISDVLSVRSRLSGITQNKGHSIRAQSIKLAADSADLTINGILDAGGKEAGGNIQLYAGKNITLNNGAFLSTRASDKAAKGGDVLLSSTKDPNSSIAINTGSQIDSSGGANGTGGDITLRALRKGRDGIAIKPIAGKVAPGFSHFYAEGVKIYRNGDQGVGNDGIIDSTDIQNLKDDTARYMTSATIQKVGNTLGKGIQLRPGVEIDYDGDLTLQDQWDLLDWRYQDGNHAPVAGSLSIFARGDLTLRNSLTDGFKTSPLENAYDVIDPNSGEQIHVIQKQYQDKLQTGNSWSYQLAAGADHTAAESGKSGIAAQNLRITAKTGTENINTSGPEITLDFSQLSTVVRTGNGNIGLAASGDIEFDSGKLQNAAGELLTYLAPDPANPDPSSPGAGIQKPLLYTSSVYIAGNTAKGMPYSYNLFDQFGARLSNASGYVDYSQDGGNVSLRANQNIKGSLYQKPTIQEWLVVQGFKKDENNTLLPRDLTTWGVDFAKFGHNVGAFGGGSVTVEAGNRIDDLTVMAPTTGRQIAASRLQTNGADSLLVSAGGNINGGIYYLGQGRARLDAGGAITGTASHNKTLDLTKSDTLLDLTKGPQILMGNTDFGLNAKRGVTITDISDPIALDNDGNTKFFTYGKKSVFSIKALAADVVLNADPSIVGGLSAFSGSPESSSIAYSPRSMHATAFGGSIKGDAGLMLPTLGGDLDLLANQDLKVNVKMSDYDPALLPSALNPKASIFKQTIEGLAGIDTDYSRGDSPHAPVPVNRGDQAPARLVAKLGDIDTRGLGATLGKRAIISSGRDINGVITVQHANLDGDITTISAGRDINLTALPQPDTGNLAGRDSGIAIHGPGDVLVTAGRNIDLGASNGIVTEGNLFNPNLPGTGASVTAVAGLNGNQPNYLGFESVDGKVLAYAENYNKYQDKVIELMRSRTGNTKMTAKTAFEQFNKLSQNEIDAFNASNKGLLSTKYHNLINEIKQTIVQFVREKEGNHQLAEDTALTHFRHLKADEYLPVRARLDNLSQTLLFAELNATGSASAADPTVGNVRGYDAINALFPGNRRTGSGSNNGSVAATPGGVSGNIQVGGSSQSGSTWQGDISLAFSQIQTAKGGNINLLAPGGNIDVGLPVPGVDKKAEELGVIAREKGNVNLFLDGDLNVNQSRLMALGGGDITVWSSHGDIDAGRGAKSAFAVSDPNYSFDGNGNLIVEFQAPVSGSGIRTAAAPGGKSPAGNVGLYAPGGVVNAAEAGIGGNNVTISATAVLGAGNIQFGGVATGVPVASTVSLAAGLTGVSNVAANASQTAEAAANMNKDRMDESKAKDKPLGTIRVEVVGFGT